MRARIWGCRGSLATPGDATRRYGGNTTSVEVRTAADELVILDAGTGIRNLGRSLNAEATPHIHLLLTHMHLDHVEGLGFFTPILDPERTITIWGPRPGHGSLADHIRGYLSPPLFPLRFEDLRARFEFNEIWDDRWELNGMTVTSSPVNHPGPTVGYRLEENGKALAFIPDNELGLDPESGSALATGADVLLHDAQYTADEYRTRVGWGHASVDHLADFASATRPARLVAIHHDPSHSDEELEAMCSTAPMEIGSEGLEVHVGS